MQAELCDLHTHSTFSDGTCSPEEIVEGAKELGLGAVALTDHNTIGGLSRFMAAGRRLGVRTIAGSELSTTLDGREVHLVALFVPEAHYDDVTAYTKSLWKDKNRSNEALAAALTQAGYPIDYEAMKKASPSGQINRSGFGDELERLGYMTKKEAFQTVLRSRRKGGLYEVPKRPDTLRTISFIRAIGAVPVLAHPFLNFRDREDLDGFLRLAKEYGLAGIETHYSTFSAREQRDAEDAAAAFDLLESGGSDFHGLAKPGIALGTGKGDLAVPYRFADELAAAAA